MAEPKKRAYAEGTKRTSFQTRDDIERELRKHGASDYGFITGGHEAVIAFKARNLNIRFRLPYPDRETFRLTEQRGIRRSDSEVEAKWEQETRRRWRALYACIKAKLVAIEDGVETFEEAFWSHVVTDDGTTVYERTKDGVRLMYRGEKGISLLEGPKG